MRIVITGGSGLIGRAAAAELAAAGHEVTVTSRDPQRVGDLPAGVTAQPWDGADSDQLAELLAGADGVVHLIGESIAGGRWTEERKRRIRDSRVGSTAALVAALARCDPRPSVLVQGSAVGYYGASAEDEVDESAPPGDDFLAEVCVDWEAASEGAEELGVRRVVIRTGLVLSSEGGALPQMLLPFKLFVGGRLGDGRQPVPWIHLVDEAGALRFLLEDDACAGPYNLVAPQRTDNRDLTAALGRVLGRPTLLPAPAFALKLALGEMSVLLLEGQAAVPRRLEEAGYRFRHPELEAALEDLLD